jgi:hypothetical protein
VNDVNRFQYSGEYEYSEYSEMCKFINDVKLLSFGDLKKDSILADYVFSISMKRMQFGWKNTLRRMLGGLFTYTYNCKDSSSNSTVFVFTGDVVNRPDYVQGFNKVAEQCHGSMKIYIDRSNLQFRPARIPGIALELLWAFEINKKIHHFATSLDMATYLFRAKYDARVLMKKIDKLSPKRVVTFCDLMPIEGTLTQMLFKKHIVTATMQHGNGNNIFYGSCSNYYLANSEISKANAIECGMSDNKVVVLGPMKYAGDRYNYKPLKAIRNLGVVLDGALNLPNNIQMIKTVHEAVGDSNICCCIRFHPNNKREDYQPYLMDCDKVYDNLEEFERDIDACIVYNSSMYTDMIYKKILVYRFKNGVIDLYPELQDRGFTNAAELKSILDQIVHRNEFCITEEEKLYNAIFGSHCTDQSYKQFFDKSFVWDSIEQKK